MASWIAGVSGDIIINNIDLGAGVVGSLDIGSDDVINWSSTTEPAGTKDSGLARSSAGVLKATNGSTGDGSIIFTTHSTSPGVAVTVSATAPTAVAATGAGVAANLTASAATAGSSSAGAAAGGNIAITSGAAARKTSGNANGGDIVITPGAGIGTGSYGILRPSADNILALGSAALRFTTAFASTGFSIYKAVSEANPTATLGDGVLNFGAGTTNAVDVGITRTGAGVLRVTDASTGYGILNFGAQLYYLGANIAAFSALGSLTNQLYVRCDTGVGIENDLNGTRTFYLGGDLAVGYGSVGAGLALGSGTHLSWASGASVETAKDIGLVRSAAGVLNVTDGSTGNGNVIASTAITAVGTAAANGYVRTGVYKRAWTNAEVVAFGAVLSGDLKVATLPAKTIVRNAYLVIDSQAAGTTTLTAAMGRTSAAYIDYIVASNAKVGANTVYGDAVAERGTNLTGYDLASYTATTDVYVQFVSTVENLSAVTTCTGTVCLLTETLP